MRCDGLLPLITQYDVTRSPGDDNPPNTRLITALFKMALAAANPKFDERPDGKEFDKNDFSTWTTNERLRYGTEQLISSIKCSKGDRIKINEANYQRSQFWPEIYTFPNWMFSDNGIRPEDINLDKIIDELIGSDATGKGLAIVPDSRQNPEDWKNFHLFFDAFGELLSNNGETGGKFNIMDELIDLIELMNSPEATDEFLVGLRHTIGSIFTRYDRDTEQWLYPDEVLHIMTSVVPS